MIDRGKYVVNVRATAAFLLGLFSANNIIYCFVVGNTPIMLINVFAAICFFIVLVTRPGDIARAISCTSQDLRLTFLYITCSVLAMLVGSSRYQQAGLMGYIALLLNIMVLLLTIVYRDYREDIEKGIFWGIVINICFVLVEFVMYRSGRILSLRDLFPQNSSFSLQSLSKSFRPMGLFKEPGHLIRYIGVMMLIAWQYGKETRNFWKYFYVIGGLLVFAVSRSSSVAYFLLGLFIFLMRSVAQANGRISKKSVAYVVLGILGIGILLFFGGGLLEALISGITDFSLDDLGNSGRILGMNSTISVIRNNSIFGSGWNSIYRRLYESGFINRYVQGSYSVALELFAELGVGSIFYYYFLINKTHRLFRAQHTASDIAIASSMFVYLLLFCTTDYAFDGSVALLLGITLVTLSENREHEQQDND